jgi:hypothetical protein
MLLPTLGILLRTTHRTVTERRRGKNNVGERDEEGEWVARTTLATAIGSNGRVAQTSVTGRSPNSKVTAAITDANGTRVDNLFSFVVYDPTP